MEISKYSILYVDDEEINLRSFQNSFRKKYKIFTAISAEEGLKILASEPIDIILSDQRMPKMTGVEFLKVAAEKFPQANRVLVTGYTDFNALESAINQANIFQYVQKPWNKQNLDEVITEALRLQQLENDNVKLTQELITKNQELEKSNVEIIISKEKAEESERLKDEFIKNMSHQIRTPLNAILAFSDLITQANVNDEEKNLYKKILNRSSNTLLNTMDKVLEVSRMDSETPKMIHFETKLNPLVDEWVKKYEIEAEEKGIKVSTEYGMNDPDFTINIDDIKLTTIMCNILENAIRYSEGNPVKIAYSISESDLIFTVTDQGVGIKMDMYDRIFERFTQINFEGYPMHGLGLGLYIAKRNTEIMGGKLEVNSISGHGTTFTLSVPFEPIN